MKLRSGKLYDPTYKMREKEFMRFDNLLFAAIWDECREKYMKYIDGDYFNEKKIKEASQLFSKALLEKVKEHIQ